MYVLLALSLGHLLNYCTKLLPKPIICSYVLVKICYKILYVIQGVKIIFNNFLASADIQVFDHTRDLPVSNAACDWQCTF